MPNIILIKSSATANSVPLAANLVVGELAINYTDGNLFYRNNTGMVTLLASNKTMSVTGNITGGNLVTSGLISATGNITGANIRATGIFYGDGSGLTGITTTGGYFSSTLTSFPTGDLGAGEPFVQQGDSEDPFGIIIVPNFNSQDPQGSIAATDLGVL